MRFNFLCFLVLLISAALAAPTTPRKRWSTPAEYIAEGKSSAEEQFNKYFNLLEKIGADGIAEAQKIFLKAKHDVTALAETWKTKMDCSDDCPDFSDIHALAESFAEKLNDHGLAVDEKLVKTSQQHAKIDIFVVFQKAFLGINSYLDSKRGELPDEEIESLREEYDAKLDDLHHVIEDYLDQIDAKSDAVEDLLWDTYINELVEQILVHGDTCLDALIDYYGTLCSQDVFSYVETLCAQSEFLINTKFQHFKAFLLAFHLKSCKKAEMMYAYAEKTLAVFSEKIKEYMVCGHDGFIDDFDAKVTGFLLKLESFGIWADGHYFLITEQARAAGVAFQSKIRTKLEAKLVSVEGELSQEEFEQLRTAIDACLEKLDALVHSLADELDILDQDGLEYFLWDKCVNVFADKLSAYGDSLLVALEEFWGNVCFDCGPLCYIEYMCKRASAALFATNTKYRDYLWNYFRKTKLNIQRWGVRSEEYLIDVGEEYKALVDCTNHWYFYKMDMAVTNIADHFNNKGITVDSQFFVITGKARNHLYAKTNHYREVIENFLKALPHDGTYTDEEIVGFWAAADKCTARLDLKADEFANQMDILADEKLEYILWDKIINPIVDHLWALGDELAAAIDATFDELCYDDNRRRGLQQRCTDDDPDCWVPPTYTIEGICKYTTIKITKAHVKFHQYLDIYYNKNEELIKHKNAISIKKLEALVEKLKINVACDDDSHIGTINDYVDLVAQQNEEWGVSIDARFFEISDMGRVKLYTIVDAAKHKLHAILQEAIDSGKPEEEVEGIRDSVDLCLDHLDELADNKADDLDEYAQECLQDRLWEGLLNPLVDDWWALGDAKIDEVDEFIDDMCYNKGPLFYVNWMCTLAHARIHSYYEKGAAELERFIQLSITRVEEKAADAEKDLLNYYTELKNALDCAVGDTFYSKLESKVEHWANCLDTLVISDDKHMFTIATKYRDLMITIVQRFTVRLNNFGANLPDGLSDDEIDAVHTKIDACIEAMNTLAEGLADQLDAKADECYQPLLWEKHTNPLVDLLWMLSDRAGDQLDAIYDEMCYADEETTSGSDSGNGDTPVRRAIYAAETVKDAKVQSQAKWTARRKAAKEFRLMH